MDLRRKIKILRINRKKVHIINADQNGQRNAIYDLAQSLKREGKHPFVVRMANDRDLTPDVAAYIECFCEIIEQYDDLHIHPSGSMFPPTTAPRRVWKPVRGPLEAIYAL